MNGDPGIYLVTDTGQCAGRGVVETVRQAVAGGVQTVQIRDKTAPAAELLQLVVVVAEAVGEQARILVNDRVDVYLAARTRTSRVHGVHVGQEDLPAAETRQIIGPDAILGLTADTPEQLRAVEALAPGTVDYLGVGAIHTTATKPDHPEPLGIAGFTRLARATTVPSVAIGGVTAADVNDLRAGGAAGAAVVSAICAADDPGAAARELSAKWSGAAA